MARAGSPHLMESVSQGHMYRDRILIEPIKPDWKMEMSFGASPNRHVPWEVMVF